MNRDGGLSGNELMKGGGRRSRVIYRPTDDLKTAKNANTAKAKAAKAAKWGSGVCLAMLAALAAFQESKGF